MKSIISILFIALLSQTFAHEYRVTVTNLTKGQPLTPPLYIVSHSSFSLFELGMPASEGLKALAEFFRIVDVSTETSRCNFYI
jgi:hypothetical protein